VQLYVRPVDVKEMRALKELRGIEKIALFPGEEREVTFTLTPERHITYWDAERDTYSVAPGSYEIQIGASSADIRAKAPLRITAD